MVKKYKKSQTMPVNVVIVAALALLVFIVLAAIFAGRVRIFSEGLESCSAKQGQCEENCGPNMAFVASTDCPKLAKEQNNKKTKCCVQVFSK